MLIVRVELCPAEDAERRTLAEVRISNVSGSLDVADYEVTQGRDRKIVRDHRREEGTKGVLRLVWWAIGALIDAP